jgi:Na+-driven multidrug efflux pump
MLTLGIGPFAGFGITGTAVAFVLSYAFGTILVIKTLFSGRAVFRLRLQDFVPARSAAREIFTVGALGGANAALSSITGLVVAGFIGHLGSAELAGYGLAVRIEYLVVPLSFAFGTALVTVVGTNIGIGNVQRAKRAAWIGGGLSALVTTAVGLGAALFPFLWLRLFTTDAEVIVSGTAYLESVGPFYGFFGLGLALYFASIGAGRPGLAVTSTALRLGIVAVGMSYASRSLVEACSIVVLAFVVYGGAIALGTIFAPWGTHRR